MYDSSSSNKLQISYTGMAVATALIITGISMYDGVQEAMKKDKDGAKKNTTKQIMEVVDHVYGGIIVGTLAGVVFPFSVPGIAVLMYTKMYTKLVYPDSLTK